MKAVILAGGLGTRISEETDSKPKPMIEIGGKPILWHILKTYSHYDINEFIICCGYKGYVIKEYFSNYSLHTSDVTIDMSDNSMQIHKRNAEPWKVTLVDTGETSSTGGRLKRVGEYIKNDEFFFFTYGDGLSDVDIGDQINFHKSNGKSATILGVTPPGRYGALVTNGDNVINFTEKPPGDLGNLINGGYFILSPSCLNYIDNDDTAWEAEPLKKLAEENQLCVYRHNGFWHAMDTLRDKIYMEELWSKRSPPWKKWE